MTIEEIIETLKTKPQVSSEYSHAMSELETIAEPADIQHLVWRLRHTNPDGLNRENAENELRGIISRSKEKSPRDRGNDQAG